MIFFDDLLNSPAYTALSAHAKEAYTILIQEYKGPYTGPKVICPYSTFQKKGMRSNTLSKSGTIQISYGADAVEEILYSSASFAKDDVQYMLLAEGDKQPTMDELMDMAEEMLN